MAGVDPRVPVLLNLVKAGPHLTRLVEEVFRGDEEAIAKYRAPENFTQLVYGIYPRDRPAPEILVAVIMWYNLDGESPLIQGETDEKRLRRIGAETRADIRVASPLTLDDWLDMKKGPFGKSLRAAHLRILYPPPA